LGDAAWWRQVLLEAVVGGHGECGKGGHGGKSKERRERWRREGRRRREGEMEVNQRRGRGGVRQAGPGPQTLDADRVSGWARAYLCRAVPGCAAWRCSLAEPQLLARMATARMPLYWPQRTHTTALQHTHAHTHGGDKCSSTLDTRARAHARTHAHAGSRAHTRTDTRAHTHARTHARTGAEVRAGAGDAGGRRGGDGRDTHGGLPLQVARRRRLTSVRI
jgi:hypothetical protein